MGNDSGNIQGGKRSLHRVSTGLDSAVACARTLAGDSSVEPPESGNFATHWVSAATPQNVVRGEFDAWALRQAFHDESIQRRFSPADSLSRVLFGGIETERVEALGANRYAGVRRNLDARWAFSPRALTSRLSRIITTVHLHGGNSTERWKQQGKPENPGA